MTQKRSKFLPLQMALGFLHQKHVGNAGNELVCPPRSTETAFRNRKNTAVLEFRYSGKFHPMHRNGLFPRPKGKPSTPRAPGKSLLVPDQQRHRFSIFKTAFGPASAATPSKIPARRARACSLTTAPCVRFCNHARTVWGLRHPPPSPPRRGAASTSTHEPGETTSRPPPTHTDPGMFELVVRTRRGATARGARRRRPPSTRSPTSARLSPSQVETRQPRDAAGSTAARRRGRRRHHTLWSSSSRSSSRIATRRPAEWESERGVVVRSRRIRALSLQSTTRR